MVLDKIRLNLVMKKLVEKDPTENRYFSVLVEIYYDQIIQATIRSKMVEYSFTYCRLN